MITIQTQAIWFIPFRLAELTWNIVTNGGRILERCLSVSKFQQ